MTKEWAHAAGKSDGIQLETPSHPREAAQVVSRLARDKATGLLALARGQRRARERRGIGPNSRDDSVLSYLTDGLNYVLRLNGTTGADGLSPTAHTWVQVASRCEAKAREGVIDKTTVAAVCAALLPAGMPGEILRPKCQKDDEDAAKGAGLRQSLDAGHENAGGF